MDLPSELELDIPNMCRVCLLQKEKLTNLYCNCIVEGYVIPLPEIIRSCLDLHLNHDDKNLPKKICDQCKIQVINFYSFKEKSKKVEQALKNLLGQSIKEENDEERSDKTEGENSLHPLVSNDVKIEQAMSLDEVSEYEESEILEEMDCHKPSESSKVEPNEEYTFSNNAESEEMMPESSQSNVETVEAEPISAEDAGTVVEAVDEIDDDEEIVEIEGESSCELLHDESENLEMIKEESVELSNSNMTNACTICDKKFETVNNLKRHLDTHNGIYFKCRICPKIYAHQASRNRHMRTRHSKQVKVIMSLKDNPFQRNDPMNPPIKIIDTKPDVATSLSPGIETALVECTKDCDGGGADINSDEFEFQYLTEELDDDGEPPEENMQYVCTICRVEFKTGKLFEQHSKYEHSDLFCSECCTQFSTVEKRNEHLIQDHWYGADSNNGTKKSSSNLHQNFCRFCQKKLKSAIELNTHKLLHETLNKWTANSTAPMIKFYTCYKCSTIYLSEQAIQNHNSLKHGDCASGGDDGESTSVKKFDLDDDSIECTDYQFLEDDDGTVIVDDDTIQNDKPFGCGTCNIQLRNENEMRNHIIIHSTKLPCPFDGCGCEYNSFSRLSLHIIHRHLNRDDFKCMHCGATFKTYDDLQNHLKKSCPERKFHCTHCEKSFFSVKALGIHMKSSIEKKGILCQICGKSFSHPGELKIHTRTHTGERPYQCNICGKAYKTASMRTSHMDAHIQGKTFPCTLCDKKLQTRTSFRNHMRRHTEDKKHQCTICLKKFHTKYHAKLHTMKIHDTPKRNPYKTVAAPVEIAVENLKLQQPNSPTTGLIVW